MKYTIEELRERHSARSYADGSMEADLRKKLDAEVTFINTHSGGLSFQTVYDDPEPFKGFGRSYGMFRNAHNYLAAVEDPNISDAVERAGYFAEQWVMYAMKLGVDTCFVSGSYSASHMSVRKEVYEEVPFIVVFGKEGGTESRMARMMGKIVHRKEPVARDFFEGSEEDYARAKQLYPWIDVALEALTCAPSAANRRPARVWLDGDALRMKTKDGKSPIDLGIAKFNFQAVAPEGVEWEWGENGKLLMP